MKRCAIAVMMLMFMMIISNTADALCVTVDKANIRVGPGKNYAKAWEVYKYMPFKKVGSSVSGDWYAIQDVDGDVNWVHKKLISDKISCAVVTKDNINVRTGPGTKYSMSSLSPAKHYHSFKVLKKKGIWVRVQDETGTIGWIHKDFLWIH